MSDNDFEYKIIVSKNEVHYTCYVTPNGKIKCGKCTRGVIGSITPIFVKESCSVCGAKYEELMVRSPFYTLEPIRRYAFKLNRFKF